MATGVSPSAVSGGSVAFEVDNLEELVETLKKHNITIKVDVASFSVCKMSVIIDTEGNAVTLH